MQVLCELMPDLPGLPSDFHGRYEGLLASALTFAQNHEAANVHRDRARRIFTALHNVPAMQDLERCQATASSRVRSTSPSLGLEGLTSAQVALQGAAALLVHVQQPEFMAREIIRLAIDSGCVTYGIAKATAPSGATEIIAEEGLGAAIVPRRFDVGMAGDGDVPLTVEI